MVNLKHFFLNQILKILCCRPPGLYGRCSSMDLPNFPANRGPGPCRKISQRRGSAAVRVESMSRASRHRDDFSERRTRKKSSLNWGVKFKLPRSFWFLKVHGCFFRGFKKKIRPNLGGFRRSSERSSWTPPRVHFSHERKSGN